MNIVDSLSGNEDLGLKTEGREREAEIVRLIADVAVTKLGGKNKQNSYRLQFQVKLRPDQLGQERSRWFSITTHKQDLESSLRCVMAMRGLARNMTAAKFDEKFDDKPVKMQLFEIGSWMQKGGTGKFGLRIKRLAPNADGADEWVTVRVHPESWLGRTPFFLNDDEDPNEDKVRPNKTYVAFNAKAPVTDKESHLPVNASYWDSLCESVRWVNVKESAMWFMAYNPIPLPGGLSSPIDTFAKRIEKQASVWQAVLDGDDSDAVRDTYKAYTHAEQTGHTEFTDDELMAIYKQTREGAELLQRETTGEIERIRPVGGPDDLSGSESDDESEYFGNLYADDYSH